MKNFRNIICVPLGITIFILGDYLLNLILYYATSSPILEFATGFFRDRPDIMQGNYTVLFNSLITLWISTYICPKSDNGKRYPLAILSVLLIPLYVFQMYGIFIWYGFSEGFFYYLISAILFTYTGFSIAFEGKFYRWLVKDYTKSTSQK